MSSVLRGNVRMALSGVRSAKWRSFLTMLGVIVGIVAVVSMVSIGEGIKRQVAGQLEHFGKDLITVRPGSAAIQGSLTAPRNSDVLFGMGTSTGLSTHDVEEARRAPGVAQAVPLGVVPGVVRVDNKAFTHQLVIGTGGDLPALLNHDVHDGEFWDEANGPPTAVVLGHNAATTLFGESVPLGHTLVFRGEHFIVRGIFAPFHSTPLSPTASFDDAIFIPYQTAADLTHNNAGLYVLLARARPGSTISAAVASLTDRLRTAHGGQQDFTVLSPEQTIADSQQVVHLLTLWITAIASISLCIGGVGIMNIMLLSVTERMHEIGVRKAIGASSRQILGQFMLEATVLSVVGGLIGIVLSFGIVGMLYAYTDLRPVVTWQAPVIATVVSLAIGIAFGVIPTLKAASQDPIEALRHE